MTRARADELAEAVAAAAVPSRPARSRSPIDGREAVAAMTGDVKALLAAGVIVTVAGLGYLVFGPQRPNTTPPVLGYVDQGPPPVQKPVPPPRPPFKLPWWR